MSILNAAHKKENQGGAHIKSVCCHTTVVYNFKCDLYNAGYVSFKRRHLHQHVQEHRKSTASIGQHFRGKHSLASRDLTKNFSVPKKCTNKFDYLLYEMFLFKNRDLLSMYSRTQFVQGILIRFLIFIFIFILVSNQHRIISSLCMFLLSVYTSKNFSTSYTHIYFHRDILTIHLKMTEV